MLVERKEVWTHYEMPAEAVKPANPKRKVAARPNPEFRKRCLQFVAVVIAVAMVITIHSEVMVRAGYDLVQMKKEAAKLEKENDLLQLEIAKLKSPQRIAKIATEELGMVRPSTAYFADSSPSNNLRSGINPMVSALLKSNAAQVSAKN
ncbi:MAG: cell division protein FtsL family protein [Firmicutes bacterium]|nr:cell division protein FtsL family protein [Bacillota bacterium]